MTQENKDLLLRDICARLPYGVKAQVCGWDAEKGEVEVPLEIYSINTDGYVYFVTNDYDVNYLPVENVRPYLRPRSSMTGEEMKEYHKTFRAEPYGSGTGFVYVESIHSFDWLNKKMFDYRGLIDKGLAIELTEELYIEFRKHLFDNLPSNTCSR